MESNKFGEFETIVFECPCNDKKIYRLIFDSGDTGNYSVEYCQTCYDNDDKQFLIRQEAIL